MERYGCLSAHLETSVVLVKEQNKLLIKAVSSVVAGSEHLERQ